MVSAEQRPSVLVVSHGFPPNSIGGTEQHVAGLVKALADRYDFRVLTPDAKGPTTEREGDVVRLPPGPKAGSVDELVDAHDAEFEAAVRRQVEEFRPDLVHVHHWLRTSNSLVRLLADCGLRVVVTLHDHYVICARHDLLRGDRAACDGPDGGRACAVCLPPPGAAFAGESLAHRVGRVLGTRLGARAAMERWVRARAEQVFRTRLDHMRGELERASAVICPSASLKREIVAVWPELEARLLVLPHGVETAWGERVRRTPSERVRFAFVSIMAPHKGIEVLLEAFRRLEPGTALLALHGAWASPDPAFRDGVQRAAAETGATLHGRYEQADLPAIYSTVDVAVAPSTCKEAASLAVREAFVGGVPVIASDLGALPEVIEDRGNGLLVRPGDSDDLADKMRALSADPGLLSRLRANVRPPRSIAQYADEMAAVYHRVGRGRATPRS